MVSRQRHQSPQQLSRFLRALIIVVIAAMLMPCTLMSAIAVQAYDLDDIPAPPDSIVVGSEPVPTGSEVVEERISVRHDRVKFQPVDSFPIIDEAVVQEPAAISEQPQEQEDEWVRRPVEFNPDPTRAVWLSALCPGLGQLYNRRYWKLPIVVGGYMGLAYATSWNTTMLSDYSRAYADITDNDPSTNSYMDFFPSTVTEDSLDKSWLTNLLQTRKNYFRRNRDICVIGMVAVYLLSIIDAYVDASLAHFDISPDLSMDVAPALLKDGRNTLPSVGLQWAFNF